MTKKNSGFQAGPYFLKQNEVAVRITSGDNDKIQLAILGHTPGEGKESEDHHLVARDVVAFLLGRHQELNFEYELVPKERRRLSIVTDAAHADTRQEKE